MAVSFSDVCMPTTKWYITKIRSEIQVVDMALRNQYNWDERCGNSMTLENCLRLKYNRAMTGKQEQPNLEEK